MQTSSERRRAAEKLRVIRSVIRHRFPTADIDRMLAEIEAGYAALATKAPPEC